jgi:hypothetical protein
MRPLSLLLPLFLVACVGPDHIEVDPAGPRFIHRGETLRLHGKVMDRNGKVYTRDRAFFRSRDAKVASVNEHGDLTAVGSGHTLIEARSGSLYAEVPVEVDLVEKLAVANPKVELSIEDEPVAVPVTPLGRDGQPRRDREVELTSDNPAIARVDPQGRIWGLVPGDTLVKARVEDKLAIIQVHVTGPKAQAAKR